MGLAVMWAMRRALSRISNASGTITGLLGMFTLRRSSAATRGLSTLVICRDEAYEKPARKDGVLIGTIPQIDFHYGNVWTNIPDALFNELKPAFGDKFTVAIFHDGKQVYRGVIPYVRTFGDVREGEPLLYLNSLLNVAFALNLGSFSEKHGLSSGGGWTTRIEKVK